jgi:hypothetical protein
MTPQEAQSTLTRWSQPWFMVNGPNNVWLALLEHRRARTSLNAFRLHCLYALVEAAVERARRAVATRRTPPRQDPASRLNRLFLMHWTDPVDDPRSSTLRATTNVVYGDNLFSENHVLTGTLNGPFLRVTINLDVTGSPVTLLTDYTANEVHDVQRTIVFDRVATLANRASQP